MDVGTLTGTIALDDQLSSALTVVATNVKHFADEFDSALVGVAEGAGIVAAAIVGVGATITAMGVQGSHVNDVTTGFDRLSGSVENAHEILGAMREGVSNTISDLELMTDANKLMAAGVKMTATDFGTLTEAARVLSKEGFGPIPTVMAAIDRAEMTGQTTRLGRMGVTVDIKAAELAYATSLGMTVAELEPLQLLEAKRQAILVALQKTVDDAGTQERSFAENISATKVAIENWAERLDSAIAASPHLAAAFDSIRVSLNETFGTSSQTLLEAIVSGVNSFADGVTAGAPKVIGFFGAIRDGLEWLHANEWIFGSAATAFGSLVLITQTANAYNAAMALLASFNGAASASFFALVAASAPLIIAVTSITAAVTIGYQAWALYTENQARTRSQELQNAVDAANLERINRALGTSYTDLATAVQAATNWSHEHQVATVKAKEVSDAAAASTEAHAKRVDALVQSLTNAAAKTDVTTEAFGKLSPAILANADVQKILLASFDAMIAKGEKLTAEEDAYYDSVVKTRLALEQKNLQALVAQGITNDDINLLKKQGLAENEIAHQLGTTTEALKALAQGEKDLDAATQTRYANTIKYMQEYQKAHADANNYEADIASLLQLDAAEQEFTKSIYSSLNSEKDRMKVIEESSSRHMALMEQVTAVRLKQAGVVNDAILREFNAQVKLNEAHGLNAVGAITANVSALDKLNAAMEALHATKVEGISQEKEEQVLIDEFTRSLYEDALAQDRDTEAMNRKTDAANQQTVALRTLQQQVRAGSQQEQADLASVMEVVNRSAVGQAMRAGTTDVATMNAYEALINKLMGELGYAPGLGAGIKATGFAEGGVVTVGEHGPERVALPYGSTVFPSDSSAGSGGTQVIQVMLDGAVVAQVVSERIMGQQRLRQKFRAS